MSDKSAAEHDGSSRDLFPPRQASRKAAGIPYSEWLAAFLGLILVTGVVGFMLCTAITEEPLPPDIMTEIQGVVPVGGGHLVRIRVVNQGGLTAAELTIEGELTRGGESIETTEVTLDYLPPDSMRRAGLFFVHDPRQHQLEVRPKSYREP